MPFRSMEILQSWVAEFEDVNPAVTGTIRVIPQDGEAGADTGLIGVRILHSPTEIYIEPPARTGEEWTVTFEPREEFVRLGSSAIRVMAAEVTKLADLCAFLQRKSDQFASQR